MTIWDANIWTHAEWNIFKVKIDFCFSRTVYCTAADKHIHQLKIILISHLHILRPSLVLASSSLNPFPNIFVVHATTNESRENHAIDFPIVHTSFLKSKASFLARNSSEKLLLSFSLKLHDWQRHIEICPCPLFARQFALFSIQKAV